MKPSRWTPPAVTVVGLVGLAVLSGCGSGQPAPFVLADGTFVGGSCGAFEWHPPEQGFMHVNVGTQVSYDTNPPASGDHYGVWVAWGSWQTPAPPEYWVHNLEHGGVVLLYKCASACPATVAALQAVIDALPADPICATEAPGVRTRTLLLPDPDLDVPVAAVAWTWIYEAQCVDPVSLSAFINAHYGMGREPYCYEGAYVPAPPPDAGTVHDAGRD
jgi:hypothetical protein